MKLSSAQTVLSTYWANGTRIIIAVIIGKALSLVWKLYLAHLGPDSFGTVEIALTIFYTLASFSLLGFHTALIRFVTIAQARHAKQTAHTLLWFSIKISCVVALCICLITYLFPNILPLLIATSSTRLPLIQRFIWIIPILAINELFIGYLAAIQQVKKYAFVKYVASPLLRVTTLLLLISLGVPIQQALILHVVITALIATTITVALAKKHISFEQKKSTTLITKFLTFSIPMSGSFLAFVCYGALDTLLVARYMGSHWVGLLAALIAITEIPNSIYIPLLDVLQSHMGKISSNLRQGFTYIHTNIQLFLTAGLCIGLPIYFFRHVLVQLFFGEKYLDIIPYIGIFIILNIIHTTLVLPLRHFLDFYGFVKTTLIFMVGATIVKLYAGILYIPIYGLMGVAIMQGAGIFIHILCSIFAIVFILRRQKTNPI